MKTYKEKKKGGRNTTACRLYSDNEDKEKLWRSREDYSLPNASFYIVRG